MATTEIHNTATQVDQVSVRSTLGAAGSLGIGSNSESGTSLFPPVASAVGAADGHHAIASWAARKSPHACSPGSHDMSDGTCITANSHVLTFVIARCAGKGAGDPMAGDAPNSS